MDYAISDIHGCAKTLSALLNKLVLTSDDTVYFLGDYVDRGPDSKGVLDIVMKLPNAFCLRGNHDDMMVRPEYHDLWMMNGGRNTLAEFGGKVPKKYLDFVSRLPLIVELPDFYLCHAGIGKVPMASSEDELLWDGGCTVTLKQTGGRRLVCGHMPTSLEDIKSGLSHYKIVIDNGCVFKGDNGYGNLVALRLDDMELVVQRNVE